MAMHMTLDDTSKITALHEYRLDSSAFKVHPDGIDIAIADVTDRRADFEENFIQPLPIKFDGVPGDGDDLVWVGHPNSFIDATEGTEKNAFWEKSNDLLKLTSGPLNLSKELDSQNAYGNIHWVEGATKMLFVESSIVGGNSGGPMLRTSDWQVYGVCTMSYTKADGQKNGAVRAEHVLETIEHGKTWDLRTMSPQAYLARFGLPKDLADSGFFSPEQGRFFDVRAVFRGEIKGESALRYEMGKIFTADELNSERRFGVWVSPERSQDDIDLYLSRENKGTAKDVATPTESRFGRLFSGADGFDSFTVRNESKSQSTVIVLVLSEVVF
jgi:hypothetical protein